MTRVRLASLAPLLALALNASCASWFTIETPAVGAVVGGPVGGEQLAVGGGVDPRLQLGVNGPQAGWQAPNALGQGAIQVNQAAAGQLELGAALPPPEPPPGAPNALPAPNAPNAPGSVQSPATMAAREPGGHLRCADPVGAECANAMVQGSAQLALAASAADGVVHCTPHQVALPGSNQRLEGGAIELEGVDPALGAQIESGSLETNPQGRPGERRVTGGTLRLRTQDGRLLEADVVDGALEAEANGSPNESASAEGGAPGEDAQTQARAPGASPRSQSPRAPGAHPRAPGAQAPRAQNAAARPHAQGAQGAQLMPTGPGEGEPREGAAEGATPDAQGEQPGANGQPGAAAPGNAAGQPGAPGAMAAARPMRAHGRLRLRLRVPTEAAMAARTRPSPERAPRGRAVTPRERAALTRLAASGQGNTRALVERVLQDGLNDGQAMFYNIPIVGRSLAVVVDVSYSMTEDDPTVSAAGNVRVSKLDVLRTQLALLMASLPQGVTVNLVAFSSSINALWPETRPLDEHNLDAALAWVSQLRPQDETRPLQAVERANAMQAEQLILLTDGRPTYADTEEPALLQLAERIAGRGARLDVVGVGPDQNAPYLDRLAERGHGVAVHL